MKLFIITTLWSMFLLSLILSITIFIVDYDTFCHFIVTITGITHREKELREVYLTVNRFLWFKNLIIFFLLVFGILDIYSLKNVSILTNKLNYAFDSIKSEILKWWQDIRKMNVIEQFVFASIILIGLLSSLFYIISSPVAVDEAMTYLYCTRFSMLVSISYYALPNNHIFFSVLTNLTSIFPFTPLINLRLPNLLIAVITNLLFFRYATLFFTRGVALVCLSFFTFTFMNFLYSFQARGYEIILLTSLITIYCITQFLENKKTTSKYLILYSLASIIGIYTVPSFLYLFVSVTLFGFFSLIYNKRYNDIKRLAKHNLLILSCVLLLYSPILLTSGIKAIISNPYTKPVSRHIVFNKITPHFEEIASWIYGIQNSTIAIFLLIITTIILLYTAVKSQNSTKTRLLVTILISSPIFVLLHSVIGFPRTWIFLTIPTFITIGIILDYFSPKFNKPFIYVPIVVFTIISLVISFEHIHRKIYAFDYCMENICSQIDVTNVNSIEYDDINGADILKYHIASTLNTQKKIDLVNINTITYFSADLVILTNGFPNNINFIQNKYTVFTSSNSYYNIILLRKI